MEIVIVGAGEVGRHLAGILSREGHRVAVIESGPAKAQRLQEALDVQVQCSWVSRTSNPAHHVCKAEQRRRIGGDWYGGS